MNNRLIILIHGECYGGKSYLAEKMLAFYNSSTFVNVDLLTGHFLIKKRLYSRKINFSHCFENEFKHLIEEYKEFLLNEINKVENCVVIAEGYTLKYFIDEFKERLKENKVIVIEAENQFYGIGKNTYHISEVFSAIRGIILEGIKSKINYQTFNDLGVVGGSNSNSKFDKLKIENEIKDKIILDIGCNNGWFCFKTINYKRLKGAAWAYGIDINKEAIDVAQIIKNGLYQLHNITFDNIDFFDYGGKFDIIFCLSTFHYFRERQPEFFDKCYEMLNEGGILVLEAGISEEKEGEIFVEKYNRFKDEQPCYYPNRNALLKMSDKFKITYKDDSVNQGGDKIKRFVFHFKKI